MRRGLDTAGGVAKGERNSKGQDLTLVPLGKGQDLTLTPPDPNASLQGKIWAVLDPARRSSKRQKDLADITRLLEAYPHLRRRVPIEVLSRLV